VGSLAALYWALDCAALGLALDSVHVATRPEALLLTYCLAQIAAAVPLLPGGAGTVEATLLVGFRAFGYSGVAVIGGVLLYRLISTWGIVPLGWGTVLLHRLLDRPGIHARRSKPGPADAS